MECKLITYITVNRHLLSHCISHLQKGWSRRLTPCRRWRLFKRTRLDTEIILKVDLCFLSKVTTPYLIKLNQEYYAFQNLRYLRLKPTWKLCFSHKFFNNPLNSNAFDLGFCLPLVILKIYWLKHKSNDSPWRKITIFPPKLSKYTTIIYIEYLFFFFCWDCWSLQIK